MADDKSRSQIKQIVDHFQGKPINQNVLDEYCNLNKLERIELAHFTDYLFQVEHDDKISALMVDIIEELKNLKFDKLFIPKTEQTKIMDNNDNVRINIVKLIEKHGISELMLERLGATLKDIIGSPIEMAGTTVYNKSKTVMRHLAKHAFGLKNLNQLSAKHIANYVEDLDKEAEKRG